MRDQLLLLREQAFGSGVHDSTQGANSVQLLHWPSRWVARKLPFVNDG